MSALSKRYTPKKLAPLTTKPPRKSKPLFAPEGGEVEEVQDDEEIDPELFSAIQESLDDEEARDLQRAIDALLNPEEAHRSVALSLMPLVNYLQTLTDSCCEVGESERHVYLC